MKKDSRKKFQCTLPALCIAASIAAAVVAADASYRLVKARHAQALIEHSRPDTDKCP